MGQPAIGKPELLVERFGIDNEGVAIPRASGIAVIQRVVVIARQLALLRPSVCVDEMPDMVSATLEQENASEVLLLEELNSVRLLKLPHRARGHAIQKHRVVSQQIPLPEFEQVSRPLLKRRDLVHVGNVAQKALSIRFDRDSRFRQERGAGPSPVALFARRRPKAGLPVWPARRRTGG